MSDEEDLITPAMRAVNVESLMHASTPAQLAAMRAALIGYVLGPAGLPTTRGLDGVTPAITDPTDAQLPHLWRHDRLVVPLGGDLTSICDVYWPTAAARSGCIVIYHGGHTGPTEPTGPQTIGYLARFLQDGHTLIRVSMPRNGANWMPDGPLVIPGHGTVDPAHNHQELYLWDDPTGLKPLGLFVYGTAVALNYTLGGYPSWDGVAMTGYSGGGWTTVVYAALDVRITRSYAVAGSLPLQYRVGGDFGDWEQVDAGLMAVASYPDLYLLAASGQGRKHVQVNNHFDPAAFAGRRHILYVDAVRSRLAACGPGTYDFYLAEYDQHAISPATLEYIAADILAGRRWGTAA